MRSDINIDDETMEIAIDCAVDIICNKIEGRDYAERRRRARRLLAEFMCEEAMEE